MRLESKRPCGCSVAFDDPRGSFINGGGSPDKNGRVYVIQLQLDDWLKRHEYCWVKPVVTMSPDGKETGRWVGDYGLLPDPVFHCPNWPCSLPLRHKGPCSTSDAGENHGPESAP